MATQTVFGPLSCEGSQAHIPIHSNAPRPLLLFCALLVCAHSACAQFQQPFVFSTGGAVMTRNDQTGVLTPVQGSPYAAATFQTLDAQGRFLFGLGTNGIHMYQVDATTGAFAEVPHSPFASSNTNQPAFIAVEPTGQYLAVVNRQGTNPGESSIDTFKIDAANLALVPVSGSVLELDSTVIGAGADLKNRHFYLFLGPNFFSPNLHLNSELNDYAMDPQTGLLSGSTSQPGNVGRCFAMDPQGRFLVIGQGQNQGQVGIVPIAAVSGVLGTPAITILATSVFPIEISTEVTGKFLYLTDSNTASPPVHIYAIDPQTLALAKTVSSPLPGFTSVPAFMGDPTGPFMYSLSGTAIQANMTDPQTGYFIPVTGTSISAPGVDGSFVFSIPPGQQNLVGPVATLTPTSLSLGSVTVGSPSPAQTVILTSTGDQALSLSLISITGANATDFSESDTCQAPAILQPSKSCAISVIFTPSATGQRLATLAVTDNAPGSPQPVQLDGTGVAPPPPQPAVTLVPGSISFPTTTQGTTSGPVTITLTNSGTATLHISSVVIGGNNPSDFSMTNGCAATAYTVNASCTIAVTFAPLAVGLRTAMIAITDDAPDSPQSVQLSGTGSAPSSTKPAVTLTPSSVSFPTITEGTTSGPQTVTVTSSGAAALHISSVVLGGTNSSDFNMTNGCTATAYAVNATCSISVTFAPLATGPRAATVTLTDDAPDSPQVINIGGSANPAITIGAAPGGSTSATITAGQTAQFNLELTPGAGYTGGVSLSCSGAPLAATCQLPSPVQVSNGNPVPFTVMVTTSGGAVVFPLQNLPPLGPFVYIRYLSLVALGILLLVLVARKSNFPSLQPAAGFAVRRNMAAIAMLTLLCMAGCGGGSAALAPVPPRVVTPSGTSTITVTPSATSSSGKSLQLQPIQLTLTVK